MNDFLTKDKRHLTLFQDNIVIDKRLLKWRRAEQGIEKTKTPDGRGVSVVTLNNSTSSNFVRSSKETISKFFDTLAKNGINVQMRREMGKDIKGACGQLRASHEQK